MRALDQLRAALALAASDPRGGAETVAIEGRLSRVYAALGDYEAALESLTRGIDAAAQGGLPETAAPLLNDLGGVYMALDEPLKGIAAFADAARLAGASSELALTARVNLVRAVEETGGAGDRALTARLDELRNEALGLDDGAPKASILLSLAELYRAAGARAPRSAERGAGRALAERALAIANEAGGDPRLVSHAYGELGLAFADLGASDEALEAMRRAVLVAQRGGASDALYRWEWQSGRLLRARGRDGDALAAYRSAIDTLAATQAALVTSRRGFERDVLPLYEEYADLTLASTRGRGAAEAGAALRDVQQTLEKLRVAEVRNYFENQCAVPEVFDPARGQPRGVLVIYPVLFADRMELLVSTGKELLQFTSKVGLAELTQTTRELRDAIEDRNSGDAYLAPARRLYGWIIEPLEGVLREAAPDTLVFVPDGVLRTVPLAVLHDGRRFLVERYSLATTPALSLIGVVNAAPVRRALVNGITEPVQGFPGLPFVASELASVERTFPARVYRDQAFRTDALEREIVAGGYSVVHMATHAEFEADYRRSFLLTYDDVITMNELEDIVGSQRYTDHPVDLLVLSACRTAAGDDRAALGLAGVAVKAGARSALASLWLINDESTAELIGEFYRQLADPKNSKAAALRGAQLRLMNDERHRQPAYWAPFLLIGDWR
ncbi:MAG TPA: CHAT domain-containing protein [Gammaproteobacteria bacterium]|nr:CHAT domain-containing protein [Gammaproteobacteria bacterium]